MCELWLKNTIAVQFWVPPLYCFFISSYRQCYCKSLRHHLAIIYMPKKGVQTPSSKLYHDCIFQDSYVLIINNISFSDIPKKWFKPQVFFLCLLLKGNFQRWANLAYANFQTRFLHRLSQWKLMVWSNFFYFPKKQCFQALAPKASASPTSKNQLPYSGVEKCGTFAPWNNIKYW